MALSILIRRKMEKNTIKVSHYVDDLGDAWASWAAVYYPGDAVTLSELQEAMDSLIIQEK